MATVTSLFDATTHAAPTVSEVAQRIGAALREVGSGWVEGEVRSITRARSGHVYLTLGDENANLDVCIWKGRVGGCGPLPAQGDLVQAHYERVNFYARTGQTSLIVDRIKPTGEGELLRRRAETLAALEAEGLCEAGRRKRLVAFPRRVGVIAGQGSDAKADVIRALHERFPAQDIVFCPATVQGVQAVGSVIDALGRLQATNGVNVIILARGGGSVADLVAFDDGRLCRAIVACAVPVITSVGHTKDRPNCDHVAAAYAPVPAKAAERAIARSKADLLAELDRHAAVLDAVPGRLRALAGEVAELWAQVRMRQRLVALGEDVAASGALLASRAETGLRRRETALNATGRELDIAVAKLPRPASLDDLRDELHRAAVGYIRDHRATLDEHAAALDVAARHIPRPATLDVPAAHLAHAGRQLRAQCRDLTAALERRGAEAQREVRRRVSAEQRDVSAEAQRLRPAVETALARARERVDHLGALLDAKDFPRHGWVLARDKHGQAVTTVADLTVGTTLRLGFADGEAAATVNTVTPEGEGT